MCAQQSALFSRMAPDVLARLQVAATDETARQVASLEGQREKLQQELQAAEETRRATEAQVQKLEQRQKTYHLVWGAVAVVVLLVVILIVLGAR
jgi:hypothetical protein